MSLSCDMILDIRHTSEFCVCVTNPMACVMKSYGFFLGIEKQRTGNMLIKHIAGSGYKI